MQDVLPERGYLLKYDETKGKVINIYVILFLITS